MNLVNYSKKELKLIQNNNKKVILDLVKLIDSQKHSGISIGFVKEVLKNPLNKVNGYFNSEIDVLKEYIEKFNMKKEDLDLVIKLLEFQPLSPLTLEEDEWEELADCFQNKRYYKLTKDKKSGRLCVRGKIRGRVTNKEGRLWKTSVVVRDNNVVCREYTLYPITPKDYNNLPDVYINCEEIGEEFDPVFYTTEEELDKIRKYYIIPDSKEYFIIPDNKKLFEEVDLGHLVSILNTCERASQDLWEWCVYMTKQDRKIDTPKIEKQELLERFYLLRDEFYVAEYTLSKYINKAYKIYSMNTKRFVEDIEQQIKKYNITYYIPFELSKYVNKEYESVNLIGGQ